MTSDKHSREEVVSDLESEKKPGIVDQIEEGRVLWKKESTVNLLEENKTLLELLQGWTTQGSLEKGG